MGRTAEMRIELTGSDRPSRLAFPHSRAPGRHGRDLTLEPAPSGTRMRWSWRVQPKGAVRLLAPVITWMGSRQE